MPAPRQKKTVHPLVAALNPDPSKPPRRTVKLFGLPGEGAAGETRLWLDDALTSYVDVPDEAIAHTRVLPDDAGSILWVDADAKLTYGSVSSHETQADFLSGAIASTHLGGAPAAGPQAPLQPPSFAGCAPTVSEACHSGIVPCTPSVQGPCISQALHCPTVAPALCPSVHCLHPSINTICPTPTATTVCHQTLFGCQSHTFVCSHPSVQLICPTPTVTFICRLPSTHVICPTPTVFQTHTGPCQFPGGGPPGGVSIACGPGGAGGPLAG